MTGTSPLPLLLQHIPKQGAQRLPHRPGDDERQGVSVSVMVLPPLQRLPTTAKRTLEKDISL